jgi:hypothetical protein
MKNETGWSFGHIDDTVRYDIDEDGIPDDEDPYIDPSYIQEVEDALNKIKNQINNKSEG